VVWRDRDRLVVAPAEEPAAVAVSVAPVGATETPWGTIIIEAAGEGTQLDTGDPNQVVVDAGALDSGLVLRPWAAGDSFRPLGGVGTRRVSDVLTDDLVAPQDRARQLVLTADGRVVWVVGHRLAEQARVEPGRPAVRLRWVPR
jgi:tRNA(Ile)-lysidine synthase